MTLAPEQDVGRVPLTDAGTAGARPVTPNGHEHDVGCWWDHREARWVCGSWRGADPRDPEPDESGATRGQRPRL